MSGGRLTWFLAGMGTGSAAYFAVDAWVLRDVGKASNRALEVRDELVGAVANSELALMARKKASETFVAPFREVRSQAQTAIADGIKLILNAVGMNSKVASDRND